jgi:hypothetical protein
MDETPHEEGRPDQDRLGQQTDPAGLEQIVQGGDCQCSDGSELSIWVREANPHTVVFDVQDGGNRFSAEICARSSDATAFSDDAFDIERVNGEVLLDWVTRLLEGAPVTDMQCVDCTVG